MTAMWTPKYFLFQLSSDNPGNLVFSPLSLHVALTMLARGGSQNSTTRIELLQALGFRGKYRRYLLRDLETFYKDLFEKYQVNSVPLCFCHPQVPGWLITVLWLVKTFWFSWIFYSKDCESIQLWLRVRWGRVPFRFPWKAPKRWSKYTTMDS